MPVYHRVPCLVLCYSDSYVNDLNYFVFNTSLRLYADDRTEYAFEPSPMVLQYVINSDLSVLSS